MIYSIRNIFLLVSLIFVSAIYCQEKVIIFDDEFNDKSKKWVLQDHEYAREVIENGVFRIINISDAYAWKAERRFEIDQDEDYSIEVTFRLLEGPNNKPYGFIWGGNKQDHFGFTLSGEHKWLLFQLRDKERKFYQDWAESDAVNPPPAFNTIKLDKVSDTLTIYINEESLVKISAPRFYGNKFGFYVSAGQTVEIDRFTIWQTNAVSQAEREREEARKAYFEFLERDWNVPNETPPPSLQFPEVNISEPASIAASIVSLEPNFYKNLTGLPENPEYFENLDVRELKKSAKDDTHSMILLGDIYRYGWQQKEPNFKKAVKYYKDAARKNDSIAYHRLAYYKESGGINEENSAQFIVDLSKSAQFGYAAAQYDLGIIYLNGLYGIEKEWRAAEYWFKKCIAANIDPVKVVESMTMLGRMYYHQDAQQYGISPNLVEAKKWLEKAHAQKDIDFLNSTINSYGKLRYLMEKLPGFIPGFNPHLFYENFEHVNFMVMQIRVESEHFGVDNANRFDKELKENLLYTNFQQVKNNKLQLIGFIEKLNETTWLKPLSNTYKEYALNQLLSIIDYSNFEDAKKYHDYLRKNNYDNKAEFIRRKTIETKYLKAKTNITKLMALVEVLFDERWIRAESKSYMPVIFSSFFSLLEHSQKAELALKADLFEPKGEFETTAEFNLRKQQAEDYNRIVSEKYNKLKERFDIQRIRFSYESVELSIDEVGKYDADAQALPLVIKNMSDTIIVPREEARSLKQNIRDAEVLAEKQLMDDAITFDIFNIKIIHPLTGSVYHFGAEKQPLYLDFLAFEDTAESKGIPSLKTKIEFIDPSANKLLDAKETGELKVTIVNEGSGTARMVNLNMRSPDALEVEYDKEKLITSIPPADTAYVNFKLKASKFVQKGEMTFEVVFNELKGFQPAPVKVKISTQEFKEPKLVFIEAGITEKSGDGDNIIENAEIIDVTALIQNKGQGPAYDSRAIFRILDKNIICMTPDLKKQKLGILQPGEARNIHFSFVVNNQYEGPDSLPISMRLTESEAEYGGDFPLKLQMKNVSLVAKSMRIEGQYSEDLEIQDVSLRSDVDKNIPDNKLKFQNRYALIIGNEDYTKFQDGLQSEANVEFARNDARVFADYAQKVLGVPKDNITLLTDAISSRMKSEIERLAKFAQYENGNAELIFYYAGHGFPDEKTKESYIMPVDIVGSKVTDGINLTELYKKLTEYPSKRVTIFLDACFSGGGRDQGLLSARAIKIKPKEDKSAFSGNLIVFSASSGEQSSLPYREKMHGMFTYYLLKKFQETEADMTYEELKEYIIREVQIQSVKVNNKDQNPQVILSPDIQKKWKDWKFVEPPEVEMKPEPASNETDSLQMMNQNIENASGVDEDSGGVEEETKEDE